LGENKTKQDIEECVLKFFLEVLCWNSCSPTKKKKGMKGKIKETADLSADFLFEVVFVLRTRLPAFVLSQELLCRIPVE